MTMIIYKLVHFWFMFSNGLHANTLTFGKGRLFFFLSFKEDSIGYLFITKGKKKRKKLSLKCANWKEPTAIILRVYPL